MDAQGRLSLPVPGDPDDRPETAFDGKTLLVTGGAGFIGSNFIRHFLGRHPGVRVINLDKLTYAGNLENLRDVEADPRYEFVQGDIRDRDLVARLLPASRGSSISPRRHTSTARSSMPGSSS